MKLLALLLAAATTACAATPALERPSGAWLVGVWAMMETAGDRDMGHCASGLPISYAPDGTYALFEESGIWRLEGDRLTETATQAHEDVASPEEVQIGRPFTSRLRALGPDAFAKHYADGSTEIFRRCPNP
jgi:hypothetical protein